MDERRLFPRVETMVKTDWKKMDPASHKVLQEGTAYSRNISEGGIGITMERELLTRNNLIELMFSLSEDSILKTSGKVVWSHRRDPMKLGSFYDIGIKFSDIPVEVQRKIRSFVQEGISVKEKIKSMF